MPNSENPQLVCLGKISGAHGINGEVLIKSFTEVWEDIAAYGALLDQDGGNPLELYDIRVAKKGVIARIKGVRYRDQAEALSGRELYIPRSSLPEQDEEDAWYHVDLIGLDAVSEDGVVFGEVIAIPNFGAGDLIEIRLLDTGKSILTPFTKECAPVVDIKNGRITVIPPEEDAEEQDD